MQRAYLNGVRVLSVLLCALGVALVVVTLANGGGAAARGVVLGALLAALGVGRLWLSRHRDGGRTGR
ncbi:MAG: hypothetical protein IRZ21_01970 [Thermoleophilaceae bacterium]|nr:hypothetical protein [Thermoleophilaceae bacterium]